MTPAARVVAVVAAGALAGASLPAQAHKGPPIIRDAEIEQLLKAQDNSLVVVGSLHLVGEGGLLELLRKDGYAATQLN